MRCVLIVESRRSTSAARLSVEGLSAGYGGPTVVRDISLEVDAGQAVALLGRNGAGKTTTLLAIAGTVRPSSGQVLVAGAPVAGRPAVKTIEELPDGVDAAMLCTGFKPSDYERNARHFAKASNHAQAVRRDGAAALDLAYVAAGRFDAFWEFDLAPWDMAAGTLLVREAGGRVTALGGEPFRLDGDSILASNGAVHDGVRSLLSAL